MAVTPTIDPSSLTTVEEISKAFKKIVIEADALKGVQSGLINQYDAIVDKAKQLKTETARTVALQELQEIAAKRVSDLNALGALASQTEALHRAAATAVSTGASKEIQDALNQQYLQYRAQSEILRNTLGITGDILVTSGSDLIVNQAITDEIKKRLIESRELEEHLRKQKEAVENTKRQWQAIGKELTGIEFKSFNLLDIMLGVAKQMTAIETAAESFRKEMGLLGSEGSFFQKSTADILSKYESLGVTAEDVYKTQIGFAKALGSSNLLTKDMMEEFTLMSTSLGISGEESGKISKSFAGITQSSLSSQKSAMLFAKSLSNAAKVPLSDVMKDLASLSESVRLIFRGSSSQLVKQTVEARRLGLTINDVASSAEKLLNFQESINAEIEASVMLGKNISFNDARVLSYRGDMLGATKSVLETLKKTVDLHKVDYFTLKSIAEASGLSVASLQESIQIQKDLNLLRYNGTEEQRKMVAEYEEMNRISEDGMKTEADRAAARLKEISNLAIQKQLQAEINQMLSALGEILMPVITGMRTIFEYIHKIPPSIRNWVVGIGAVIFVIAKLTGAFTALGTTASVSISSIITAIGTAISASITAVSTAIAGAIAAISVPLGALGAAAPELGLGLAILGGLALVFIGFAYSAKLAAEALKILVESFSQATALDFSKVGEFVYAIHRVGTALGGFGIGSIFGAAGQAGFLVQLYALNKIVPPLATSMTLLADSFSRFVQSVQSVDVKKLKEIRESLGEFKSKDVKVLEALGNLKTNISAGIEGGEVKSKESANTAMAETIKSAVVEGMRQVKISISMDGKVVGTGIASALSFNEPASAYTIGTKQGAFK
jgi:hypothetical protein